MVPLNRAQLHAPRGVESRDHAFSVKCSGKSLGVATSLIVFNIFRSYLSCASYTHIMALLTSETPSRDVGITDRTRSMFRAILAENGIADTDDAILDQEMVMFFKLSECSCRVNMIKLIMLARSHRIKLGRPGDFAGCPVVIDDDNGYLRDTATHDADPVPHRSNQPSFSITVVLGIVPTIFSPKLSCIVATTSPRSITAHVTAWCIREWFES